MLHPTCRNKKFHISDSRLPIYTSLEEKKAFADQSSQRSSQVCFIYISAGIDTKDHSLVTDIDTFFDIQKTLCLGFICFANFFRHAAHYIVKLHVVQICVASTAFFFVIYCALKFMLRSWNNINCWGYIIPIGNRLILSSTKRTNMMLALGRTPTYIFA